MHIKLDDKVSNNFKRIFNWIVNCTHYMFVLKGGRYSAKSVTIGQAIVLGVMTYKKSAVCLMQYKADLGEKLVDNFTFCINNLGVSKYWKLKKSPYEYVLLDNNGNETNISIRFYGCDDMQNTKGFKSRTGEGFKYIWFEEANRFRNWEVIQAAIDTCDRLAGEQSCVILSYNPPRDTHNFMNEKFGDAPVGKALGFKTDTAIKKYTFIKDGVEKEQTTVIHHSTLEDLIDAGHSDWVKDSTYGNAMESKQNNPKFYSWNYLGALQGGDAQVLWNIYDWTLVNDISSKVESVLFRAGLDCSNGGNDNWFGIKCLWVPDKRDIYILGEFDYVGNIGSLNSNNDIQMDGIFGTVADKLKALASNEVDTVYGDGANKYNILGVKNKLYGLLNLQNAKEGYHYSKERSVTFLQGLNHIYIDKYVTPEAYRQLNKWSYQLDKDDKVTCKLKDGDDHACDALLYSLVRDIEYDY